MKRILAVIPLALLIVLLAAVPALAYAGTTGRVIDSMSLTPWIHGGEVYVLNMTTGALIAACPLTMPAGTFSCTYGVDGIGGLPVSGVAPMNGDQIRVIIDYSCPTNPANCSGGPYNPNPPGNTETNYTELAFLPGAADVGDLKTGTGPNVVTLTDATAESPNLWLPLALAVVALVLLIGTVLLLRRRRIA